MSTYRLTSSDFILRDDGASIPPDPTNLDYQDYLAWVDAGNTPDPVVIIVSQVSQRTARIAFRARQLEKAGDLLAAYVLRNNL